MTAITLFDNWNYIDEIVYVNEVEASMFWLESAAWAAARRIGWRGLWEMLNETEDDSQQNAILQALTYTSARLAEYIIMQMYEQIIDQWFADDILDYLRPRCTSPRIIYGTPPAQPKPVQLSLF